LTVVGEKLRAIRLARGLTQEELASRSGYGVRTLRRIERGQAQPHPRTLREIAQALGVDASRLLPDPSLNPDEPRTARSKHAEGRASIEIRVETGQEDAQSCALASDINAELARRLSRVRVLDVSVADYDGLPASSGEESWRAYELTTRVRIDESRVRVWIALSDPHARRMLWADRFDLIECRPDVLALCDRASEQIFAGLHTELLDAEIARSVPADVAPAPWDEMMHAIRLALRKTPEGIEEGIGRLEVLLRTHPDFFPACATLATLLPYHFSTSDPERALRDARELAERCVRLDPRYVPGQTALAAILTLQAHHSRALAHAQIALDLEPLYGPPHRVLAEALLGLDRLKEGLAAANEAIRLTPDWDPLMFEAWLVQGICLFAAGELVRASDAVRCSIAAATGPHAQLWLAVCLAAQGQLDDARSVYALLAENVSVDAVCTLRGISNQPYAGTFDAALAILRKT